MLWLVQAGRRKDAYLQTTNSSSPSSGSSSSSSSSGWWWCLSKPSSLPVVGWQWELPPSSCHSPDPIVLISQNTPQCTALHKYKYKCYYKCKYKYRKQIKMQTEMAPSYICNRLEHSTALCFHCAVCTSLHLHFTALVLHSTSDTFQLRCFINVLQSHCKVANSLHCFASCPLIL